jgi:hypothetical protein
MGSKGGEKEASIIFSESGITSVRAIQIKEALRELLEAGAWVQFEFSKGNDYGLSFIDVYILLNQMKKITILLYDVNS